MMFEPYARNGSVVTPRMAGIESTANTTSVSSIITSTRNSGVTMRRPASWTKKCSPW